MQNQKINYQLVLDKTLSGVELLKTRPKLLLHSCCGPCSSYVLEVLKQYFDITVFYFNPCIYPFEEYQKRVNTQRITIANIDKSGEIKFTAQNYDHKSFLDAVEGFENEKEGGKRCTLCYTQRLERCAEYAKNNGFDYFCTTLSVSPYKNASKLNLLGEEFEKKYNVKYLYSDFKKKNGYKRSIELSKEFNLYRQEYCGCEFSLRQSAPHSENNLP